jgi:NADH-quinone oxidoreductase subunit N
LNGDIIQALTGYMPLVLCEAVLGVAACVLFLGGTWRGGRSLWAGAALVSLGLAAVALAYTTATCRTVEAVAEDNARIEYKLSDKDLSPPKTADEKAAFEKKYAEQSAQLRADVYASPVSNSRLALFLKVLALAGGAVLVLTSWNEVPDNLAAEYHACILLMTAGLCLTGAANELITLFLALELISIPTYILLYLPRSDERAQESAMKYFLLSIFSSALLLFGFSYLYGTAGTTNLTALGEALTRPAAATAGLSLTAMVLVTAGLGFRITAVPFHFYAPDVYQGTTPAAAAILAFVPKVAGFAALLRVFGFTLGLLGTPQIFVGQMLEGQGLKLLWILAAVTMTLGNVLALLQNDLKRLLAYSSVAHAGYMLVGLAAAPLLGGAAPVAGVEAVVFYLVAYGAMTIGAFAIIAYLSTPQKPVETVDDLDGLSVTHPGIALLLVLFLFSLIGMPLTAGFWGKLQLIFGAMDVPPDLTASGGSQSLLWFVILALITAVNAAVGAWYYLRIAAVMYLRTPLQPLRRAKFGPVLIAVWICAIVTLGVGVYPLPLQRAVQMAVRGPVHTASPMEPATAEATIPAH